MGGQLISAAAPCCTIPVETSRLGLPTVADAMIRFPKTCAPATTVREARGKLLNDHVHALLVVDSGQLLAVVKRVDLTSASADTPAWRLGLLAGRVVDPDVDLDTAWRWMLAERRRRLAVVDNVGRLLGLLCLKRTGRGFCTDAGVLARARERRIQAFA
jgi:CBS domain-containing protein